MRRLACVMDNETTGLTLHPDAPAHKTPRMIEFAAVLLDVDTGDEVEAVSILVNPEMKLPPEIIKITGLTDDDLKGAPTFAQAMPRIMEVFSKCAAVFAHNLPFDRAIIYGEMARLKEPPPFAWWPKQEFCTVGLYRDAWGYNVKLLSLYEAVLGKPLEQTHRALDDVRALVEIIRAENLLEVVR